MGWTLHAAKEAGRGDPSLATTHDFARAQAAEFPKAGLEIVPDAEHFLTIEEPKLIAETSRTMAAFCCWDFLLWLRHRH